MDAPSASTIQLTGMTMVPWYTIILDRQAHIKWAEGCPCQDAARKKKIIKQKRGACYILPPCFVETVLLAVYTSLEGRIFQKETGQNQNWMCSVFKGATLCICFHKPILRTHTKRWWKGLWRKIKHSALLHDVCDVKSKLINKACFFQGSCHKFRDWLSAAEKSQVSKCMLLQPSDAARFLINIALYLQSQKGLTGSRQTLHKDDRPPFWVLNLKVQWVPVWRLDVSLTL